MAANPRAVGSRTNRGKRPHRGTTHGSSIRALRHSRRIRGAPLLVPPVGVTAGAETLINHSAGR